MNILVKTPLIALVVLIALGYPAAVAAEDPKIAIVITQKLLTQTEAGKAAATKLQAKKKASQEKLDAKAKEIQGLQADLAKRAMVLSDDQRVKARDDFERKQRDAARMKEDLERELQKMEAEILGGVNRLLTQVVVDYGKANGYSVVLDATATLYFSQAVDITDDLIKAANAAYKKRE